MFSLPFCSALDFEPLIKDTLLKRCFAPTLYFIMQPVELVYPFLTGTTRNERAKRRLAGRNGWSVFPSLVTAELQKITTKPDG